MTEFNRLNPPHPLPPNKKTPQKQTPPQPNKQTNVAGASALICLISRTTFIAYIHLLSNIRQTYNV